MLDSTIIVAVNEIANQQSKATENTRCRTTTLLDYLSTHPNAKIKYRKSDMILKVESDESYLSIPGGRSRAGGHFFFGDNIPLTEENKPQGACYVECSIIKPVVSSAAEASIASLFINAQKALILRRTAEELGHPQPQTPIKCDNTTAESFINCTIVPKRSKAMDMRFWWLRDKELTNKFKIYWQEGKRNKGDYYTKHHSGAHHQRERKNYLANSAVTKDYFKKYNTNKFSRKNMTFERVC